jgi:hypothetical protein
MQLLMTLWQQFIQSRSPRARAEPTDAVDALSDAQQQHLQERWWHWRHHYLEAKRELLDARRDH